MSMFTAEYQDFKREDPTVLVKVTLYDDQKNVIKPAISKAKLVQGTKYAGDYEITQDGDQYCLSTKQIAKLPSGSYGMELWGDDGSIYPSAGFIPIRIHRNADDSLEQVDPTVDLNKIIEDMHNAGLNLVFDKIELLDSDQPGSITSSIHDGKNHITLRIPRGLQGPAGKNFQIKQTFESIEAMNASKGAGFEDGDFALISSNIEDPDNSKLYVWNGSQFDFLTDMSGAKGDKGDTGTVDNAGLTTAPAFVSLQTQVNNSAVGTNLIVQSELKPGYINRDAGGVNDNGDDLHSDNYIPTNGATVFTLSSPDYVFKGNMNDTLSMYDSDKKFIGYQIINSPTQTLSKPNAAYIRISINFVSDGGTSGNLSDWLNTHRYKLEKGSVATDWCPNPTEILTQVDYAKIQAAIVTLGGSLK